MDKLLDLLKMEAKEIQLSFDKAKLEGTGTPQEVADRRESAFVNAFLRKYFPFPYRIVKGNIIDSFGNRSNSIDCIILSPSHPYTIDAKNESASIIFADGVDVAIEVKPDLANETELYRALIQVQSVKKLRRKRSALLGYKNTPAEMETSYHIPTYIFAEKTYSNVRLLVEKIVNFYLEKKIPLSEQFDYIIINNRLIIFNSYRNGYAQFKDNYGILFSEVAENTLAAFLLWLNRNPKSEMEIGKNVLGFYLDDKVYNQSLKTFPDLNFLKQTSEALYTIDSTQPN